MLKFIIEDRSAAVFYRSCRTSFLLGHHTGVKISVRKDRVYIHIETPYCVIINDIRWAVYNGKIRASKKALKWLER